MTAAEQRLNEVILEGRYSDRFAEIERSIAGLRQTVDELRAMVVPAAGAKDPIVVDDRWWAAIREVTAILNKAVADGRSVIVHPPPGNDEPIIASPTNPSGIRFTI